jgi:hypothetical protein
VKPESRAKVSIVLLGRRSEVTDVRQQGNLMADGPPINMFLKAKRVNGHVDWDLGQHNPPVNGKARVNVPEGDGCNIVIHLVPTPGINASFDTSDPVWIQEGGSCPPQSGNNCPDQIDRISCDRNTLTMHDTNSRECRIIYQMNFTGAPACDPEIKNGGSNINS